MTTMAYTAIRRKGKVTIMRHTLWVCDECGSAHVYYDTYVSHNVEGDIREFDQSFCDRCEGETDVVPITFDTRTWLSKEALFGYGS